MKKRRFFGKLKKLEKKKKKKKKKNPNDGTPQNHSKTVFQWLFQLLEKKIFFQILGKKFFSGVKKIQKKKIIFFHFFFRELWW